eukprot:scaffold1419_cov410-Prasinococcus_capsulatus_cf.AAC.30
MGPRASPFRVAHRARYRTQALEQVFVVALELPDAWEAPTLCLWVGGVVRHRLPEGEHEVGVDLHRGASSQHRLVVHPEGEVLLIPVMVAVGEEDVRVSLAALEHPLWQGYVAAIAHVAAALVEAEDHLQLEARVMDDIEQLPVGGPVVHVRCFRLHHSPPYVHHHAVDSGRRQHHVHRDVARQLRRQRLFLLQTHCAARVVVSTPGQSSTRGHNGHPTQLCAQLRVSAVVPAPQWAARLRSHQSPRFRWGECCQPHLSSVPHGCRRRSRWTTAPALGPARSLQEPREARRPRRAARFVAAGDDRFAVARAAPASARCAVRTTASDSQTAPSRDPAVPVRRPVVGGPGRPPLADGAGAPREPVPGGDADAAGCWAVEDVGATAEDSAGRSWGGDWRRARLHAHTGGAMPASPLIAQGAGQLREVATSSCGIRPPAAPPSAAVGPVHPRDDGS